MHKKRVVLATGNAGKLREMQHVLTDTDIELVTQSSLGVPEAEETGLTFVENAILKARNAAQVTGLPAIADDSGLEVDALNGAPGIYSARYGGKPGDDRLNNQTLLNNLQNVADNERTARFRCVIVYLRHAQDPTPLICQGTWEGRVLREASGSNGFGYDPLFFVPEQGCSAAELSSDVKNRISHRGQALRKLITAFKE